jgi:hypothetical protein
MSSPLLSILTTTMFATQAILTPAAVPKKTPPRPSTMSGCVGQTTATPWSYTFFDTKTGANYRLSGVDVREEARKRGEIVVGTGARRVTIRGGLVPSANVAAQASAMDPSQVAIASLPGGTNNGSGSVQLPEFHVTLVQGFKGSCP